MAASRQNGVANGDRQQPAKADADLAQAFKEIAEGERHAAKVEGQLDALEKKIDELLAHAEQQQRESAQAASTSTNNTSTSAATIEEK